MMKHKKILLSGILFLGLSTLSNYSLACEDGSWVSSVSSGGEIVILDDNSVWEIDAVDRVETSVWTLSDNIVTCEEEDALINTDTGDKVSARKIR